MIDWRLHLVTSGAGRSTVRTAAAAAAAGVGIVQVRCKEASAAQLLDLTIAVAEAVAEAAPRTRVILNDRADIAYAARLRGAPVHGVHLGQDDLPVADARAMLGADAIIGLTAGTLEMVAEAQARRGPGRPTYLGSGPFRCTPSKDVGRPPIGVQGYRRRVGATTLPMLAIGDVTCADIPALSRTGIAGVALIRELMDAADPADAAAKCLASWDGAAGRVPSSG